MDQTKIFLVDDDGFTRALLRNILESNGFTVYEAEDGIDALAKLKPAGEVDLIISDINMPNLDGLGLISELRARERFEPIIVLTGNREIATAVEAMKAGADEYLTKDENLQDTLLFAVDKCLENYRIRQENLALMHDLKRKNEELERMAFLDELTGIANRRYFSERIKQEWGRAMREQTPLTLIMADIDYFKQLNDTYGHDQGDFCLREVSRVMASALHRDIDFIARYGGEEFMVILPGTDIVGAAIVAEAMRLHVQELGIENPNSKVHDRITISLGITSMVPRQGEKYSTIIAMADRALYAAKAAGRNRISKDNS